MQLRPYQDELLTRVHQSWASGHRAPCVVLPCGGGKSCIVAEMARRCTQNGGQVLFLVHRQELAAQITRTFTQWGVNMDLCMVGMVQTVTRRIQKIPKPRLIITDENHHCPAQSYKRIYEAFPDTYMVGVTATPVRLNGDGLGDINDDLIVGVSAKWLIANGCLAPYDYYAPTLIQMDGIPVQHGEYSTAKVEAAAMSRMIYGDMISHYRRLASGRKTVCYCATVAHSNAVAKAFCEAGIAAVHMDGDMSEMERKGIINRFREGDLQMICNVDLISEGFDVPDCTCVILCRPTKSLSLYIQQSMRCMRYQPGKRAVIIDHVGNYSRFGMPDADRTWSLSKREKREKNEFPAPCQCPECFFTFDRCDAGHDVRGRLLCPVCGCQLFHTNAASEMKVAADTELQKIDGFTLDYQRPEDCRSYKELEAYGKARGYKRGWAYYQAKMRGMIAP